MRRTFFTALLGCCLSLGLADSAQAEPRHRHRHRGGIELKLGRGKHAVELRLGRRARRHQCTKAWVAGRFEVRYREVQGPGCYQRVWVPARYETVSRRGCQVTRLVAAGHYERQYVPGAVRRVAERVWVPGYYSPCRLC